MHNKRLELVELTDKELAQIDGGWGWVEAVQAFLDSPIGEYCYEHIFEPVWETVTEVLGASRGPCSAPNEAGVDNYNSSMIGM